MLYKNWNWDCIFRRFVAVGAISIAVPDFIRTNAAEEEPARSEDTF
jgi:hypothetical protein